jgi:sulfatase maturation enzyme AslB (radical SAM superfamily)
VSLDGLEEKHDRQRGLPCFDKAVEVLTALAPLDLALQVSYTITPGNVSDILPTYEFVKRFGANFNSQFAQTSSVYYGDASTTLSTWGPELEDAQRQIQQIADERWSGLSWRGRMTDTGDYYLSHMVDYQRSPRRIFTCYSGTHSCFIDPYGDVYACLMMDRKLGNALSDGFDAVWDGAQAKEVRGLIARRECHCWTPCEAGISLGRSAEPVLHALTRSSNRRAHRAVP